MKSEDIWLQIWSLVRHGDEPCSLLELRYFYCLCGNYLYVNLAAGHTAVWLEQVWNFDLQIASFRQLVFSFAAGTFTGICYYHMLF